MAAEVDFTKDVGVDSNGAAGKSGDFKANEPNEDRKLFIGGLSWETREDHLKEYFGKFGTVEKVELKLDPMTGRSRGFAFVVYDDKAPIQKVMDAGDHAINSKKVDVKRAKGRTGKLFVGGLKAEMTDDDIKAAFGKFGNIVEYEMPMDKMKKQRKGFGFITFEKEETMKELLKKGHVEIGEHKVDLRKAAPKNAQGFAGGAGAGGGGYGGYGGGFGGYGNGYGPQGGGDFYGSYGAGGGYDYSGGYGGGWGGYGGGWGAGGGGYGGGGKMTRPRRGRGGGAPY